MTDVHLGSYRLVLVAVPRLLWQLRVSSWLGPVRSSESVSVVRSRYHRTVGAGIVSPAGR